MLKTNVALCGVALLALSAGCGDDATNNTTDDSGGSTSGTTTSTSSTTDTTSTTDMSSSSISSATTDGSTGSDTETAPAECGNSLVEGDEGCDDGNLDDEDGCSAECEPEEGFACDGEPSVCTTACGNGAIDTGEQCDDQNTDEFDGCSPTCEIEPGYTCDPAEPTVCTFECGDGLVALGSEECDDANDETDDGCDACSAEPGYVCTGAPSFCQPICGDGAIAPGLEECDDNNLEDLDGCTDNCIVEAGYSCDQEPSTCSATCGDDTLAVGAEICDNDDVAGRTCSDEAFTGGVLACNGTCDGYDTSGCFNGGEFIDNSGACNGAFSCGDNTLGYETVECMTSTLTPPITVYAVDLTLTDLAGIPIPDEAEVVVYAFDPGPPNATVGAELIADAIAPSQEPTGFITHNFSSPVTVPGNEVSFCVGLRNDTDFTMGREALPPTPSDPDTSFIRRCGLGNSWLELSSAGFDGAFCMVALVNGT